MGAPVVKERNYALDLLRILSMLMIVFLHSNSHGGMFYPPETGLDGYVIGSWVVEVLCIVSVNVFVLISGYFLCEQSFRLSRVVRLMLQTVFYSWIISAVMFLTGKSTVTVMELLYSVFPISFERYWFISAYIGLYLLSPVLNKCLSLLTKKQHAATAAVLVVLMAVWNDLIPTSDPFGVGRGYSLIWFVVLYVIAAYIRKHLDVTKVRGALLTYFGASTVLLLLMLALYWLSQKISVLYEHGFYSYYARYNSTIVLVASVALFVAFLKLRIQSDWLKRIIRFVSPLTLGVYLIHDNPRVREVLWQEWFPLSSMERNLLLPLKTISIVLLIFVVCITIDYLRARLFAVLEARIWYKNFLKKIDDIVFGAYERVFGRLK